jgi:hypothetical protein
LDELHVVGDTASTNPPALAAGQHHGIAVGEDVADLRVLVLDGREVVRDGGKKLRLAVGFHHERKLRRREDVEGHIFVRIV